MFKVLVNHNFTPDKSWIGDDYLIYDRSDDGVDHLKDFDPNKVIKTQNLGQVDYDKLSYIVDNYDNLPDVFLWGKTNLFKPNPNGGYSFISPEEYELVKDNQTFTPLLTQNHRTYADLAGIVCLYCDGMYYERNPIIVDPNLKAKYFNYYADFAKAFGLPNPNFIPFAPGGNYILTKEVVHRYPKESYDKMRSILPYTKEPIEAFWCEKSYFTLWN